MEYLPTIKQLSLFKQPISDDTCPICKKNKTYHKRVTKKKGYTECINGRMVFYQTGVEDKNIDWWCCKVCAKLPINVFIAEMQKHFGGEDNQSFLKEIEREDQEFKNFIRHL